MKKMNPFRFRLTKKKICYVLAFIIALSVFKMLSHDTKSSRKPMETLLEHQHAINRSMNAMEILQTQKRTNDIPWYIRPYYGENLWDIKYGDRFHEQQAFAWHMKYTYNVSAMPMKYIAPLNYPYITHHGRAKFDNCPVNRCNFTQKISNADVVIFNDKHDNLPELSKRKQSQIWIYFQHESPPNSYVQTYGFNWTVSYRLDATFFHPYFIFIPYDPNIVQKEQNRNYAEGKTKKVFWVVSNCGPHNDRMQFAKELGRYIGVDIYGKCGTKRCSEKISERDCHEKLSKQYKFYLAFENSNCKDYITEKPFLHSFSNDLLPIVMGAAPEEYRKRLPHNSYIHVDHFQNAEALGNYLNKLDQNDALYNNYFKWKGTGEVVEDLFFWCRLCAMLHSDYPQIIVPDAHKWWVTDSHCRSTHWPHERLEHV